MSKAIQPRKTQTSPILAAVHDTAKGFHSAGLIDKITMKEFDVLCLPPVPDYNPRQIASIRNRNNMSQGVFAALLGVSASSVQKWENGLKKPSQPLRKMLNVVDRKGAAALM